VDLPPPVPILGFDVLSAARARTRSVENQHARPGDGAQSRAHVRHITEICFSQIDKRRLHGHDLGPGIFHDLVAFQFAQEGIPKNLPDPLQVLFRNWARLRKKYAHVLAAQLTVFAKEFLVLWKLCVVVVEQPDVISATATTMPAWQCQNPFK
jgi:hypothetical protein